MGAMGLLDRTAVREWEAMCVCVCIITYSKQTSGAFR